MPLPRLHLTETTDLAWLPLVIRRLATEYLTAAADLQRLYSPIAPRLGAMAAASQPPRIVDLAAGAGGPWRHLLPLVREHAPGTTVQLTDLHPTVDAMQRTADAVGGVTVRAEPLDARAVPENLPGVRTIFAGLHHLRPPDARQVFADAVAQGQSVLVVEPASRRLVLVALMVTLVPLVVLLVTPVVRPFRLSRLLFTYVIPVAPLLIGFDGAVSCLRTYTSGELHQMATDADPDGRFEWHSGESRSGPGAIQWFSGEPHHPRD